MEVVLLLLACFSLAACGGGTCTITATDYDQSCTTAADCVGVFAGNICTAACSCGTAFINKAEIVKYQSDFDALSMPHPTACPCPSGPAVACVMNRCAAASSP